MRKTDRNSLALEILDGALNPTKKCIRKRLERARRLRTKANRGRESRHFDGIWRATRAAVSLLGGDQPIASVEVGSSHRETILDGRKRETGSPVSGVKAFLVFLLQKLLLMF